MKKFLLILSLIFLITLNGQAQTQTTQQSSTETPILFVFPNPAATSDINFKFQRSYERGYFIQIFNFLGKKMYEARNLNETHKIKINEFQRGFYIYQLLDRNGKVVESGKFQVSRPS